MASVKNLVDRCSFKLSLHHYLKIRVVKHVEYCKANESGGKEGTVKHVRLHLMERNIWLLKVQLTMH